MSLVYKARDMLLDRTVAVKVLRAAYASDEDVIRRLRREAQAAASLSHPNIVGMYDVGQEGDAHYLVMEYIAGQTLKQKIQRLGSLPVQDALVISEQICEALEHAHAHGVIHRDIKPHNIMLTQGGKVKVADFGIARAAASSTLTHSGTIIGSVHYFSPEQARGAFAGEKSDIYSLGVVMYEMLTGKVPFEGDSPITIALKHVQEEVVAPRRLKPDIPAEVERVVMTALAKEQSRRYQSAAEMLADIRKVSGKSDLTEVDSALKNEYKEGSNRPVRNSKSVRAARQEKKPRTDSAARNDRRDARSGRRKRRFPWFILLVLLMAALAWGGLSLLRGWLEVPTVAVPDVTGKSLSEANRMLQEAGLVGAVVAEKYDESVASSHIISQQPEPGEMVRAGRTINLTVSMGQEFTVVPELADLSVREAMLQLSAEGLELGSVRTRNHPTVPADTIISQNPRAGTRVAKGTQVDVEVSAGAETLTVVVPNLVGDTQGGAVGKLESLKLEAGAISRRVSNIPEGIVLDQDPTPGTELKEGSTVDLVVSAGPTQQTRRSSLSFLVPSHQPSSWIRITVTDSSGTNKVYEQRHSAGTTLELEIEWMGTEAKAMIYVDNVPYREEVLR